MWMTGFLLARQLYPMMRPLLQKAVNKEDAKWDDVLMGMLDGAFGASHNTIIEPDAVMTILEKIYELMRPILLKAIDDPDAEWDDYVMTIADRVFNYNG